MEILKKHLEATKEVDIFLIFNDILCLIKWGHSVNMNHALGNCCKDC